MTGRTSVVVAHRLSTIRNANSIAVVYRWVVEPATSSTSFVSQQYSIQVRYSTLGQ